VCTIQADSPKFEDASSASNSRPLEVDLNMHNNRRKKYLMILVTISIMTPAVARGAIDKGALQAGARTHIIINEVRHELATLPYYGVGVPGLFDVKNELQVETDRPR